MGEGTSAEELTAQAIDAASEAIAQYAEAKLPRFAMEATRAVELGAKAALAKINPVLIADPRSIDSQLYLAGNPVARSKEVRRIRTISCREALERVTRLIPALRVEDVDQLISVRDGSTHYVASESDALESLVIPFLGTFLLLQQHLELSDDDVFGSYADLVSFVREKHTKEVDRKVATKIARAKHAYEERYGHLDPEARRMALRANEANIALVKYDEQTATCPACDNPGVISGQHEFQEWEQDEAGVYPVVTLFASDFRCPTCGLHLQTSAELVAAGLEYMLDVEDAETEDFAEDDFGDDWEDR